ncbi:MAG: Asp-tRNA(Asn)/Glu-tRNA(Gln) amidotransferase subunit GatA [Candidatus Neomarinimicrobiota bacterium]|nr:Asp-tRNA(Asn)/Glu-tRNA(Gln) amidotransferase subunit GatA [Candidatus Neomarinimicrobiota bacterium]
MPEPASQRPDFTSFKDTASRHSDQNAIVHVGSPLYNEDRLHEGFLGWKTVAVKDNIAIKGWPLSCASHALEGYVSPYHATVTERILDAGSIIVARTNHDEFAMGSSSEHSTFGATKHPSYPERVPGGSSGGSAVAVALGMTDLALGSDTGGSVRQPAAFCGIFGLKPTYGRVSRYGLTAFASSFDQIGPFARSTEGIARMLQVIAGYDPKDATSADQPVSDYLSDLDGTIPHRVGIPWEFLRNGVDPDILSGLKHLESFLRKSGCEVREIKLPHAEYAISTYYVLTNAEASSNLARYDGVRYGLSERESDLHAMYHDSRTDGFGDEVKRRIMLGTYVLSSGYYDAYFRKAQQVRRMIRDDFINVFTEVDAILLPTTPSPAFKRGEHLENPLEMYLSDIFTTPMSLAGVPALNIPVGETSGGLPIGLQLVANFFQEETILRLSHFIEQSFNPN